MRRLLFAFAAVLAAASALAAPAAPARAQARELHWKELAVEARLDDAGRLHVTERQVMVFTGDWNGGQRIFRLRGDQDLDLESVTRIDADGAETRLDQGSLDVVNQFDWTHSRTLRWRSRAPDDPPFNATEITYILVYTLSNFLVPRGDDRYLLDHSFVFTDREGEIERFTLDLDIDPVWEPGVPFARRQTAAALAPGAEFNVTIPLRYTGAGRPAGVSPPTPRLLRVWLGGGLILLSMALAARLFRREAALGRFAPLPPQDQITKDWISEHVLAIEPEVVGAAYDDRTGAAEVAAVIARMVAEKKIQSRVIEKKFWIFTSKILELTLLVDRNTLDGYELSLVSALFFAGQTTSTEKIAKHYRKTGFDPAALIRDPLKEQLRILRGLTRKHRGPSLWPLVLCGLMTVAALIITAVERPSQVLLLPLGIGGCLLATLLTAGNAYAWRRNVTRPELAALRFLVPLVLGVGGLVLVILRIDALSALGAIALALLGVTFIAVVMRAARSSDTAAGIALRQRLAAARRYFARELRREGPHLDDAWFPYLIALDLGPEVDHWFAAFGGEKAGSGGLLGGSGGGGLGGGGFGSGTWTGGGGAFGGGGASATWSTAAHALATGVATPSSSSSGGGGGGSSSGGGGGGGW